jgi:hypothetical protein
MKMSTNYRKPAAPGQNGKSIKPKSIVKRVVVEQDPIRECHTLEMSK